MTTISIRLAGTPGRATVGLQDVGGKHLDPFSSFLVKRNWNTYHSWLSGLLSVTGNRSEVATALGRILREHRLRLNLSREQFAEMVDLSKNYIGNLERGEHEVTITTLNEIPQALGTTASELIMEAGF